jgi:hypothetical protein
MFMLFTTTLVPAKLSTVGSNVMVKDPITGSTGAPASKPLAVKLMMSVIVAARAGAKETLNAIAHNTLASAELIFNFMSVPPLDRMPKPYRASRLAAAYINDFNYIWTIGRTKEGPTRGVPRLVKQSADAVATSREGRRTSRSGRVVQHPRWGRGLA